MLDPWRLTLLVRLADLGTVHAVATASHLTPSTVSHQLRTLEREAGADLLQRSGRRLLLTPAGSALVRRARPLLHELDALGTALLSERSEPTGTVRIATFTSALRTFVLPTVSALRAAHPALTLEVRELEPHESLPALLRGELEVAVTAAATDAPLPSPDEVTFTPLGHDTLVVVTPDPHPARSLAELADTPWVGEPADTYLSRLTVRLCGQAGFSPTVQARLTSYDALLDWVAAGLGVSILPRLAVGTEARVRTLALPAAPGVSIRAAVRAGAMPTVARAVVVAELERQASRVL